jgi:hypothetical protein
MSSSRSASGRATRRCASRRKRELLTFLESAYQAGAGAASWDDADLTSSWYPGPDQLASCTIGRESYGLSALDSTESRCQVVTEARLPSYVSQGASNA